MGRPKRGKHKSWENSLRYTESLRKLRTLGHYLLHCSFNDVLVDRAGIEGRSPHATILRDLVCNQAFFVSSQSSRLWELRLCGFRRFVCLVSGFKLRSVYDYEKRSGEYAGRANVPM